MLVVFALISVTALAVLLRTGGRVTPFYIMFGVQSAILVGYGRKWAEGGMSGAGLGLELAGFVAVVAGYLVLARGADHRSPALAGHLDVGARRGLALLAVSIAGLTIYHFAVVGIPVFADSVELARWEFSSSGLLGIPGRAFLIGMPTMAGVGLVTRLMAGRTRFTQRYVYFTVGGYVLSKAVSGFKGAIVQVAVLLLLVWLTERPQRVLVAGRRVASAAVIALVFAGMIAGLYNPVQRRIESGQTSAAVVVYDRITIDAVRSGALLLDYTAQGRRLAVESPLLSDFGQFIGRVGTSGTDDMSFGFIQTVSAEVHGRVLGSGAFIVPTTPGIIPVLLYEYGEIVGLLLLLALGAGWATVEAKAYTARSLAGQIASPLALYVIYFVVTKGNIAFLLVSWALVAGPLLVVVRAATSRTSLSRAPSATMEVAGRPVGVTA